jgi:RNA polymerase sigma factor (sigma-70 family)
MDGCRFLPQPNAKRDSVLRWCRVIYAGRQSHDAAIGLTRCMDAAAKEPSDEGLLLAACEEPEAFGVFYRRHVRALAAYFWRRTQDAELTADLTAETFAAALDGCRRFDPGRGAAVGWLYGIAHRQLALLARRGAVEMRYRRRMGMARIELHDEELERIATDAVVEGPRARVLDELQGLPAEQRAAVQARVVHELDYAQIALSAGTSELVVRKRVSRGLATLRERLMRNTP